MKKLTILLLILVLSLSVLNACTTAPQAAPEVTPEAAPAATAAPETAQSAEESKDLDVINVTAVVSNTDGVVVIKAVESKIVSLPYTEEDPEGYTIEEGDTKELTLKKDAVIDFPMADDLVNTVTITGEEFDGEFRAFKEQLGDESSIIFTYEMDGEQVSKMKYVYLP